MLCHKFEHVVSEYIDGMLNEEEQLHWDDHVKLCSRCQQTLKETRILIKGLSFYSRMKGSDRLYANIRKQLSHQSNADLPTVGKTWFTPLYLSLTLAAVILFFLVIFLFPMPVKELPLTFFRHLAQEEAALPSPSALPVEDLPVVMVYDERISSRVVIETLHDLATWIDHEDGYHHQELTILSFQNSHENAPHWTYLYSRDRDCEVTLVRSGSHPSSSQLSDEKDMNDNLTRTMVIKVLTNRENDIEKIFVYNHSPDFCLNTMKEIITRLRFRNLPAKE